MSACSFDRLLLLLNQRLDLDGQLLTYDHLDRCDICRDAIYQLARDQDEAFFIYRSYRMKPAVLQHTLNAAAKA